MKTLSLKQPFAELVVSGRKIIELRKWNTHFRGEFLIHASKIPDKKSMKKFGFEKLPLGMIVGKSELVEVKKYLNESEFVKDKNKHLAEPLRIGIAIDWKKFGFVLKNSKRIKQIPAKGMLGFWKFDAPKYF